MRVSRMMAANRNGLAEVHRWDAEIEAREATRSLPFPRIAREIAACHYDK
jgi:hypothetical protein